MAGFSPLQATDALAIERRVMVLLSEHIGIPEKQLQSDMRFIQDLGLESLDSVEFLMACEEAFDVEFPDSGEDAVYRLLFNRNGTVRQFVELIEFQLGTKRPQRLDWYSDEKPLPVPKIESFTQLRGKFEASAHEEAWLLDEVTVSEAGHRHYRRRTDGMVCVDIPASDHVEIGVPGTTKTVSLASFIMDIEPVSTTAYARFLNSIERVPKEVLAEWFILAENDKRGPFIPIENVDGHWRPRQHAERWPMILVSWFGANAYALWANGGDWRNYRDDAQFLPSECQWEYAARGDAYQRFPWGDREPDARDLRTECHRAKKVYAFHEMPLADVNALLGVSPFGLRHMAGNVWHWCRDWFSEDWLSESVRKDVKDPWNQVPTVARSECGGSWIGPSYLAESSFRRGRSPIARGRCLGFRCCRSLAASG